MMEPMVGSQRRSAGEPLSNWGGKPHAVIQWKEGDVFFDFWCECGAMVVFAGQLVHLFKCSSCDAVWAMPIALYPLKVDLTLMQNAGTAEP